MKTRCHLFCKFELGVILAGCMTSCASDSCNTFRIFEFKHTWGKNGLLFWHIWGFAVWQLLWKKKISWNFNKPCGWSLGHLEDLSTFQDINNTEFAVSKTATIFAHSTISQRLKCLGRLIGFITLWHLLPQPRISVSRCTIPLKIKLLDAN